MSMDLTTQSIGKAPVLSSNSSANAAVLLNVPDKIQNLPPNTILNAQITSPAKAGNVAIVQASLPDGETVSLEVKLPLNLKEGTELQIKLTGQAENAAQAETSQVTTNTKNADVPVKISIATREGENFRATVLPNAESGMAKTQNITQVFSFKTAENPIKAFVIYNAATMTTAPKGEVLKDSSAIVPTSIGELQGEEKTSFAVKAHQAMASYSASTAKASPLTQSGVNPMPKAVEAGAETKMITTAEIKSDSSILTPAKEEMVTVLDRTAKASENQAGIKTATETADNPLPARLAPKGSEITVRFLKIDIPATANFTMPKTEVFAQNNNPAVIEAEGKAVPAPTLNQTQTANAAGTTGVAEMTGNSSPLASAPSANMVAGAPTSPFETTQNTPSASLAASYTVTGNIVSMPQSPHTVVANTEMTLSLGIKSDFPVGSLVKLEVLSFKEASLPLPISLSYSSSGATAGKAPALPDFKDFGALLNAFKNESPESAAMLTAHIPQANAKLAQNLFSFVQAGINGDAGKWLGVPAFNEISSISDKGRKIISRLKDDFAANNATITTDNAGVWRALNIPFLNGQNIEALTLYLKRFEDEGGENQKENANAPDIRFLFELNFSALGRTQIDGIANKEKKKLDMVLRTAKKLPLQGMQTILMIYDDTLKLTEYRGKLAFIVAEEFVEIKPKQKNLPAESNLWA